MEMSFCRRCGNKLNRINDNSYKCDEHVIFVNCIPTTGVFLVNNKNEVLLSIRKIKPHKGMLDAFGGFLDGEETIEYAIKRELQEEIGLQESEYSEPQYLCSGIGHYNYGNENIPVISSLFWARLKTDRDLIPADDVAGIHITNINNINFNELHDDDIRIGIKKLKVVLSTIDETQA